MSSQYGFSKTCVCRQEQYKPAHYYTYDNLRVFFCESCRQPLSLRQVDAYHGSEAMMDCDLKIKIQREARGLKDPLTE